MIEPPQSLADYADYSVVYDAGFDDITDDLAFWHSFPEPGVRICEMGCGTGRVTAGLAGLADTVGVDPSREMLTIARGRLPESVELRTGELCAIPASDAEFDQLLCVRGAFSHLVAPAEQVTAMRELARVVRPGGLLVIDIPYLARTDPVTHGPTEMRFVKEREHGGQTYEFYFETTFDPVWTCFDLTQYVLIHDGVGNNQELRTIQLRTKVLTMPELMSLLLLSGFGVEEVWGGYDRSPFGPGSDRLIVAGRRVEEAG